MVINVLDYVRYCYSHTDGQIIFNLIFPAIKRGEMVTVSFKGVNAVPSSFVNAAFINLLEYYTFETIRDKLKFASSTKQINEMIKRRFDFEVNHRKKMVAV